jgi:hypothetical protein
VDDGISESAFVQGAAGPHHRSGAHYRDRHTKRVYNMALEEFLAWFQQAPRPGFTKATVSDWRPALGICVVPAVHPKDRD